MPDRVAGGRLFGVYEVRIEGGGYGVFVEFPADEDDLLASVAPTSRPRLLGHDPGMPYSRASDGAALPPTSAPVLRCGWSLPQG